RKQLLNVFQNIDQNKFEVTAILSGTRSGYEAEGDPIEAVRKIGVTVISIPMVRNISPLYDFKSFHMLQRLLLESGFDVVHAHCAKAGFLCRAILRSRRTPRSVYSPHVFPFQRSNHLTARFYRSLERLASNWSDTFVVDCEEEKVLAIE